VRVLEAFETSDKLIDEGLQCDIEFGGKIIAKVWVKPTDPNLNRGYARELAQETIALKGNGLDELDEDEDREILYRIFARTVIVRWEFTDPADKKDAKLKFNEKNAVALFKRAPKFFAGIQQGARRWDRFRKVHEEQAAGN
jgi:hypothetical protein